MPATAGKVRMPHDNRVMTSGSLSTTSVWKDVIRYDPYAAGGADGGGGGVGGGGGGGGAAEEAELLEQSRGLAELARLQAGAAGESVMTTCREWWQCCVLTTRALRCCCIQLARARARARRVYPRSPYFHPLAPRRQV